MTQEITIWSWEAESSCSTGRDRGFISIYLSSTGSSASYWPRSKDLAAGGIRTTHAAVLDKALPEKWKWSEENPILLWWEKGKPPRKKYMIHLGHLGHLRMGKQTVFVPHVPRRHSSPVPSTFSGGSMLSPSLASHINREHDATILILEAFNCLDPLKIGMKSAWSCSKQLKATLESE